MIGTDGSQLGIMSSRDAYMMAREQGEDLVEMIMARLRQEQENEARGRYA